MSTELSNTESPRALVMLNKSRIRKMLEMSTVKGIQPDKIIATASHLIRETPSLQQASPASVVASVVHGAQLGLSFQPHLGQAYIVPFWDKKRQEKVATLIIGYKGYIKLAYNSGAVSVIEPHWVGVNDEFQFSYGLNPMLHHVPNESPGELKYAYCLVRMKDGNSMFNVMHVSRIMEIKRRSKAKGGESPWNTDFNPMAMKCPIREITKYLPLSEEAQEAIADDNDFEPRNFATKYFPEHQEKDPDNNCDDPIDAEFTKQPESLDDFVEPTPEEVRAAEADMSSGRLFEDR